MFKLRESVCILVVVSSLESLAPLRNVRAYIRTLQEKFAQHLSQ